MAKVEDIGEYFDEVLGTWQQKEIFIAAFKCAELAALYIDISARKEFGKGKLGTKATGTLAGSFNAVPAEMKNNVLTAGAYSPLPYASIRETGGTIRPKGGRKALAVPLTSKAKNTGSPLLWQSAKKLVYIPPKPGAGRKAAGVFAIPIGSKSKEGKQKFSAQYMLRRFVKQKGSGYITKAAEKAGPAMDKLIGDAVLHVFASTHVYEVK